MILTTVVKKKLLNILSNYDKIRIFLRFKGGSVKMEHRNRKKLILTLFILLSFILHGCTSSDDIKRITNSAMSPNFLKTIESYFKIEDDGIDITVYGFNEQKSAVSSYAMANLLHELPDLSEEDEMSTNNPYLLSTLLTLAHGRNELKIDELVKNASQRDFAIGFRVLSYINDNASIKELSSLYHVHRFENEISDMAMAEALYTQYNEAMSSGGEISRQTIENAQKRLASLINKSETTDNLSSLFEIHAIFSILSQSEVNCKEGEDYAREFMEVFREEGNQRFLLAQDEVVVATYLDIYHMISELQEHQKTNIPKFWVDEFEHRRCIFNPFSYSLDSPRNLAYLCIALSNTDIRFSEIQIELLRGLVNNCVSSQTDELNWQDYYYLAQAASALNMQLPYDAPEEDGSYMCNLFFNTELDIDVDRSLPILEQLIQLTISSDKYVHEFLDEFNVMDYESYDDFPMILNLYVELGTKTESLTTGEKKEIINWIKDKECPYGYESQNGNFDFEVSVIYTHLLNLLKGGSNDGYRIR